MSKKLLLIFAAIPLFFSCKKDNDSAATTTPGNYYVDGFHDVGLSPDYLTLSVHDFPNTKQDPVTITAEGLPEGINADITSATGTPPFTCLINFTNNYIADVAGITPIQIVTTSKYGSRRNNINLTVPALSGYEFGGYVYDTLDMQTVQTTGSYPAKIILTRASTSESLEVRFGPYMPLPTASGTYKIRTYPTADDEVALYIPYDNSDYYRSMDGATLDVKFINGKIQIKGYKIRMKSTWGSESTLAINYKQP